MNGRLTRSRGRFGPVLWATAAFSAVYTMLAAGIAIDRATVNHPELAAWVPAPFRQHALAVAAQELTRAGQPEQTLHLATSLLERDPLSPEAAGLLGNTRLARGNTAGAEAAYRASARLGWRDSATQVYWFDAAMTAQDINRAALRFSAIARQWPNAAAIDPLSKRLQNDPRGLAMLAQQIASGANWATAYATPRAYQPIDQLAERATVLVAAGALGGQLGCDKVAPLVGTLTDRRPRLAAELWASQCPRAAALGKLADGGFEAQPIAGQLTAFDWQFPGNGALAATMTGAAGNRALQLHSSAASLVPVVMQRLILPSQPYRISWDESGSGAARIAASLSCQPERSAANPQDGEGTVKRRSVTIMATGECDAPLLQLWVKPGAGPVIIDNVEIMPL